MSSFFDEASLVMIPSGYKDQKVYSVKPLDGTGDLTFSRASNATRVGPDGLIEKVRTNLLLQSNTFSTTWSLVNATATSGQSGYDGSNNAWLLQAASSGTFRRISQNTNVNSVMTNSIYAKAGTVDFIAVTDTAGSSSNVVYFDLANGVIDTIVNAGEIIDAQIQAVGGGWYRCSAALTANATGTALWFVSATGVSSSNAGDNVYIQDAQQEVGTIATQYLATTTAPVSTGPVSGLPRLDYLNSSCPRLLLEPQRTNLVTYSEQLDNADWTKTNVTITANDEVSPDGYTNADKITDNANNTQHRVTQTISVTSGTSYTASIFVKNDDKGDFAINFTASGFSSTQIVFNLINGTVTSGTGTIQDYGNGWYRISATAAANATGSGTIGFNLGNGGSYVGSSQSVFIYGAQIEAASYASSYVNTLGAAVTRVADAASKTGISSLIGQTDGTLFFQFQNLLLSSYPNETIFQIVSGTNQLWARKESSGNTYTIRLIVGGVIIWTFASVPIPNGNVKLAVAYKTGDSAVFLNGSQFGSTNTSAFSSSSFADLNFNLSGSANPYLPLNQALLFKTRLTNAQLAELTTL